MSGWTDTGETGRGKPDWPEIGVDCYGAGAHSTQSWYQVSRSLKLPQGEDPSIDMFLAHLLRGEERGPAWEENPGVVAMMRRVEFHGIAGLLGHLALDRLPCPIRDEVRRLAVSQEFWEAQHIKRLRPLLEQLERRGACPLIIKGTALAYTLYDKPSTRRRGDTDILVRESSFDEACQIVRSFGFTAPADGLTVRALGARSFVMQDEHGFCHEIDLHQRINSSPVIAKLFPFEELKRRSEPVLKIGPGARAIGLSDALLVACFHRLIHSQVPYYVDGVLHLSPDRLVWLYDIKLIHDCFEGAEEQRTKELAKAKGLLPVLVEGLGAADRWLKLGRRGLINRLGEAPEPTLPYRYLHSGPAKRWVLDLRATQRRGRMVLDSLAPPQEYMRRKYRVRRLTTLPYFYVWRALHGLYKAARRLT